MLLPKLNIRNKKGVTMSLNVIIAAIVALIILVVISVLIMARMGIFGRGTACAGVEGGMCIDEGDSCGEGMMSSPLSCPEGSKCCIPSPIS